MEKVNVPHQVVSHLLCCFNNFIPFRTATFLQIVTNRIVRGDK